MIRINLLGEKADHSELHILQMLGFGTAFFVMIIVCGALQFQMTDTRDTVLHEKEQVEARLRMLTEKTQKVDELEKKKKFLADKLITIAGLKSKKQGPAKLLGELTTAVPDRAWLRGISQKGESVEFTGVALDNQTVSKFMQTLGQSEFFSSVDLGYSRQYIKGGVKLQEFAVNARLANSLQKNVKKGQDAAKDKNAKPEGTAAASAVPAEVKGAADQKS